MIGGPNELALYLTLAFLISLCLLRNTSKQMKYLIYTGLTLIATTLWLTYSRGAFLTIIIFLILYIVIHRGASHWKALLPIVLISFLCATGISKMTNYLEGESIGSKRFSEALSKETVELSKEDGRIYYVKKHWKFSKTNRLLDMALEHLGMQPLKHIHHQSMNNIKLHGIFIPITSTFKFLLKQV